MSSDNAAMIRKCLKDTPDVSLTVKKLGISLNFPDKRYLSLFLENEHTNNIGIRLAITTECYSGVCLMSGEKGEAE